MGPLISAGQREVVQGYLADADVAMVTSYCPDGPAAADDHHLARLVQPLTQNIGVGEQGVAAFTGLEYPF